MEKRDMFNIFSIYGPGGKHAGHILNDGRNKESMTYSTD